MLKSGFFAVEVFPKVLENETPITKVNPKFETCCHSGGLAVNLHYYRLVFQSVCLVCQYLKQETLGRSVKQSIFSITLRYYEHCMWLVDLAIRLLTNGPAWLRDVLSSSTHQFPGDMINIKPTSFSLYALKITALLFFHFNLWTSCFALEPQIEEEKRGPQLTVRPSNSVSKKYLSASRNRSVSPPGLSVTHLVKQMKDLVSNYKETVVLRSWENEKRKFGVKLIDTDKITIVS